MLVGVGGGMTKRQEILAHAILADGSPLGPVPALVCLSLVQAQLENPALPFAKHTETDAFHVAARKPAFDLELFKEPGVLHH